MRPTLLLLLVSTSCAPAAAPENRPVVVSAPASRPSVPIVGNCDPTCQRELLAGVELELGDERAKTAAESVRASALERQADELTALARHQQSQLLWAPMLAGAIGTILGGLVGVIVATVHR